LRNEDDTKLKVKNHFFVSFVLSLVVVVYLIIS